MAELGEALPGWKRATVARRGELAVHEPARRAWQLDVSGSRADAAVAARLAPWLQRVEALVRELDERHFHFGIDGIESAQLVRYGAGGHYRWHRDALDHRQRKLTALCYLSDHRSHALRGGETSFAPPELPHRLLRRRAWRKAPATWPGLWLPVESPRCGRALVFDATLQHRAHRVRRGTKLVLNVWFR